MRKSTDLTELQKQIIKIVSKAEKPYSFFKDKGITARCITYWKSGQRQPKEITVIEVALEACGYELKIVRKPEPQEDCTWR